MPCLIHWPGMIKPGTVVNDIASHEDFIPTFAAAAGETGLVDKLKTGHTLDGKTFKVHLDGNNLLPFLKGEVAKSPREDFLYWSADGELMALRVGEWKVTFMEQHTEVNPKLQSGSGRATSPSCARPIFTTCVPTRSNAALTACSMAIGRRIGCSCSCRRKRSSRGTSRASRNFRCAPRPRASPSAT